jgi:hypothetical protein
LNKALIALRITLFGFLNKALIALRIIGTNSDTLRQVFPVRSSDRQNVSRINVPSSQAIPNLTTPGHRSMTEIDNHAHMTVAGANFYPIAFTCEVCDVSPFSDEYLATKDIPIASCATVVTDPETGDERILIVHQALWFGSKMPISLLQPNQCCAYGIEINDDPMDSSQGLGMHVSDDFFLPFMARGPTILFESRCPSQDELLRLRQTMITDDCWDPTSQIFGNVPVYTEDHEYNRLVSLVNTDPQAVLENAQDELNSEFDVAMSQISAAFLDKAFIRSILSSVRVATHVRDDIDAEANRVISSVVGEHRRHSKHDAETIARKWGIGLDQARHTLEATTQKWGCTGTEPLSRRYRADHLLFGSHQRCLPVTMATDTLFSKVELLRKNTCAQVYTTGKYTFVNPTRDASGDLIGQTLWNLCNNIGIPNRIIASGRSQNRVSGGSAKTLHSTTLDGKWVS